MRELARWPLLLAAVVLSVTALGVDVTQGAASTGIAVALLALAATAFGAFLYAEGARHREWWDRSHADEEDPT